MVIRDIRDLDCNNIHITHPYKHTDEYYIGEVYYNKEPLIIQTPIITFKKIEDDNIELLLDKTTLKAINKIDNYIIKTLSEMSSEWFKNELTIEDTRDIHKSSISFPADEYNVSSITLKCNDNLKIYDKHNSNIDQTKIIYGTPLIALIKLNFIMFYKYNCMAHWECMSIKLKQKTKFTECKILDDENENQEDTKLINLN